MPAESVVERALEGVSDGQSVDWDALESGALDEHDRECLKWLRVLGQIADLHHSTEDPLDESDPVGAGASTAEPRTVTDTWGRFELLEKVGEGSFGSVYRAWDPQLESELAIKILHQKTSDARLRARLLEEGRWLAKIRHPNVVRVIGIESHEDRVGLCMDFVRGQTLDDVLRTHGTMSASETVVIGLDVCGALAAVHRAGFIHRDVKARNVLREQGGRIVLMDFGAGRGMSHDAIRREDMTGTPLYMAPELLEGEQASAASDVYSVGVLLYHLVTSEYPVQAASVEELRAAHRQGRRRFLSELRPDLPMPFVRVVERALTPEVGHRYPNAGALLDALGSALREETEKKKTLADRLVTLVSVSYFAVAATGALVVLGILSSRTFNLFLGRSDFVAETLWDWLIWGAKSTVLPAVLVAIALVLASHLVVLRRFVTGQSVTAARLYDTARQRGQDWARRHSLYDAAALSSLVLVSSAITLAVALWHFYPLFRACFGAVATAPVSQLANLSPALGLYNNHYREAFTFVILCSALAWYGVLKLAARQGQRVDRSLLAGGAAVILIAVSVLSVPYRLLRHNDFEMAKWNGNSCYVIGERPADLLLFCPELEPRSRVVLKTAATVDRSGLWQGIFTRFSPPADSGQGTTTPAH